MTRPGWIVAVLAPAAAVAAAAWPPAARPGVEGTPVEPPVSASARVVVGQAVGAGGCSSVGCHGAPGTDALRNGPGPGSWTSSAIVWAAADPHRKAYAVLEEKLARDMMARLHPDKKPEDRLATNDARCLACHTNPTLATDSPANHLRAEGVSCEACHGNASSWLRSHMDISVQNYAAGYDPARLAKLYDDARMTRLYDLGERALACVGCHVGAPADPARGLPVRDMNHDMIAAGHPRLNFDFATYQFMLPRHWHERDRTKPGTATDPDFEARAWLVGRVAHAEAACQLTADRAQRGDPWPEFGESSCVSCHHAVTDPARKYPEPVGRRPGSLPWQPVWPVTRPDDLAAFAPFDRLADTTRAVSALLGAMQRSRPAANAGDAATTAARELAGLRRHTAGLSGSDSLATAGRALDRAKVIPAGEWDRDLTEQVYHARAAVERAKMARGAPGDPAGFAAAARKLTLPRGTVRFDLPEGAADAVRGLLK